MSDLKTCFLIFAALGLFTRSNVQAQHLYWTQEGPDLRVVRAGLDGQNAEGVIPGDYVSVRGIAIDTVGGWVYVANNSPYVPSISRINLATGAKTDLVTADLGEPSGITLDPVTQTLFWTHTVEVVGSVLERSNFDGSERTVIRVSAVSPMVDSVNGTLYWTGTVNGVYGIHRSDFDGSQVELVIDQNHSSYAVDAAGGKIYWCREGSWSQGNPSIPTTIYRANLDGTGVELLISREPVDHSFVAVAVDSLGEKIFWLNRRTHNIESANLDGSGQEIVVDESQFVIELLFDAHERKILWVISNNRFPLKRSNGDGTGIEEVVDLSGPHVESLQIDPFGGFMYWNEYPGIVPGRVSLRSLLDGSNVEILNLPAHGAIDRVRGRRYWISTRTFYQSDLDGSNVEALFEVPPDDTDRLQNQLEIDPYSQKIYWTTAIHDGPTTIWRANFNGTNVERVLENLGEFFKEFSDFVIDPVEEKIYWLEMAIHELGEARLYRSTLDGEQPGVIAEISYPEFNYSFPMGPCHDSVHRTVYWSTYEDNSFQFRRIHRYDLQSGETSTLQTGLREAIPSAVSHDPTYQAEPGGARYVQLTLPVLRSELVALRVTLPDYPCVVRYVGSDGALTDAPFAQPVSAWGYPALSGAEIVPDTDYTIEAVHEDGTVSVPISARTRSWGDVAEPFAFPGGPIQPDFGDIHVLVNCFRAVPGSPMDACDLYPAMPDGVIDFRDISSCVDAFRGVIYPFALPQPCP